MGCLALLVPVIVGYLTTIPLSFIYGLINSTVAKKRVIYFLISSAVLVAGADLLAYILSTTCRSNTNNPFLDREMVGYMLLLFIVLFITSYLGSFLKSLFTRLLHQTVTTPTQGDAAPVQKTSSIKKIVIIVLSIIIGLWLAGQLFGIILVLFFTIIKNIPSSNQESPRVQLENTFSESSQIDNQETLKNISPYSFKLPDGWVEFPNGGGCGPTFGPVDQRFKQWFTICGPISDSRTIDEISKSILEKEDITLLNNIETTLGGFRAIKTKWIYSPSSASTQVTEEISIVKNSKEANSRKKEIDKEKWNISAFYVNDSNLNVEKMSKDFFLKFDQVLSTFKFTN